MSLTELQKRNLSKIDCETSIELLRECVENLGLYSVGGYAELTGMKKRTIYDHISTKKVCSIKICDIIFIVVND